MGYISSATTVNVISYLTYEGRRLYTIGDDKDIIPKYFTLGDSDNNYFVSPDNNELDSGSVPDLTGNNANCIKTLAQGIDIKYKIKSNFYPKGAVRTQFCEYPYTLKREISNGDGTFYWETTQNSPSCSYVFLSQRFTKTISLPGSVCSIPSNFTSSNYISITSSSPLVVSEQGKFTGTTQDEADNKAIEWLNGNEAYQIALNNNVCTYTYQRSFTGTKNNCPQGEQGSTVTVSKTFSNTTGLQTEGDIWLNSSEPQMMVNSQGTCAVLGPQLVLVNQGTTNLTPVFDYSNSGLQLQPLNTNLNLDLRLQGNMLLTNEGTPFVMNTTSKYKIVLKLDRSGTRDKTYVSSSIFGNPTLPIEETLVKPNSSNQIFNVSTPIHYAGSLKVLLQNDNSTDVLDSFRLYADDTLNSVDFNVNPLTVVPVTSTISTFDDPPINYFYFKEGGGVLPRNFKDNVISEYVIDNITANINSLNKINVDFSYVFPTSPQYLGTSEVALVAQTYQTIINILLAPNNRVKFLYEIYEYI